MAYGQHPPRATVLSAKQQIINKLCTAYLRSQDDGMTSADLLRQELGLSESTFMEALNSFVSEQNPVAVEVVEGRRGTNLRLGEFMRNLCSDWTPTKKP
jgi:hypothetical protein